MGLLKRCTDLSTGETLVVKVVRTNDVEVLKCARAEFEMLRRLSHPNVVQVKQMYYDSLHSHLYLLQNEIKGVDLSKFVRKRKRCTEDEARIIFKQLLHAIDYIHRNGICHRDIKPENIIVIPETLEVKLADFNVSKDFTQVKVMNTHTGTVAFSAPEMLFKEEYT